MKERCWEIMDLHNAEMEALKEEKKSLIKRLAEEIERSDTLEEVETLHPWLLQLQPS